MGNDTPTDPMSTSLSTRSGVRVAKANARPPPKLFPTSDVFSMPSASRKPTSCSTHRSIEYVSSLSLKPKPAMSGASTLCCVASVGMVRRQFAHADTPGPDPCTSTTGEPSPVS